MRYYETDKGVLVNLSLCNSIYIAEYENEFFVKAVIEGGEQAYITYTLTNRCKSFQEARVRLDSIKEWLQRFS